VRLRLALDIPRPARHSFRWDALAGALTGAYMGMTFPFFVRIARGELNTSETLIAVMSAAPFIGNLLAPLWARQMEGKAKLPFVIGSWVPARLLLLLMPLATFPLLFVGLVSGLQFVGTISGPAYTTLMRDIYPDRARGRLLGYVRVGAQATMFAATLIAGRLLDHHISYRYLFPVAALFGLGAAYAFSRVRALPTGEDAAAASDSAPAAAAARTLSTREFVLDTLAILRDNIGYRWFAASVMTYGFGNLMVVPLYALYQVDVLHISNTQVANLANFASLASIVGMFFWGRFIDRKGAGLSVLISIGLIALIPVVYLLTRSVEGLFFAAALSGFGFAGIELSYMQSILTYAEPGRAAQYQSLHSLLLGIRGVLAPLAGIPLMKAFGYPSVFTLALVIMLAGCFMQWMATRRESSLSAPA
jgi:MFS family permease